MGFSICQVKFYIYKDNTYLCFWIRILCCSGIEFQVLFVLHYFWIYKYLVPILNRNHIALDI